MITVSVASQFSKHPAGRNNQDGNYSGERFRRRFLVEPLRNGQAVTINFNGVRGCGSSFLDEAFGGLVRDGLDAGKIKQLIKIESNDPSLEIEIFSYIDDAL
jgi:hypothetical protein